MQVARLARSYAVPVVLLTIATLAKLPTLGQPLLEDHAFRQTQTAFTALIYHQQGIEMLRPQVPVLGPPWTVPFELPLFQAGGAMLMSILPPDTAMRTAGLATFVLTGWLLHRLAVRIADRTTAHIALAAYLFSPFGMLWGRTSLIEYLATAAALGFLLAGMSWRSTGSAAAYGTSLLAGAVAMSVKLTTGGFYLLPLLLYRRAWRDWRSWLLVAIPIGVGLAWTGYADAVKAASEGTAWLTSTALRHWTFGTPMDRLDPHAWWSLVITPLFTMTGGALVVWIVFGVLRARELHDAWFVLGLLAAGVAPLIVIMPLYRHDYYFAAISPVVALSIGLSASWLWARRHAMLARGAIVGLVTLWLLTGALMRDYWTQIYGPPPDREGVMQAAEYIRAHSEPDELVAVLGRGWNPAVHYYGGRWGWTDESAPEGVPRFVCPYREPCRGP